MTYELRVLSFEPEILPGFRNPEEWTEDSENDPGVRLCMEDRSTEDWHHPPTPRQTFLRNLPSLMWEFVAPNK